MKKFLFLILLFAASHANATSIDFYFEDNVTFDPNIPKPETVLGYQVGEWHVRHDQLVNYMHLLAQKSDRINIEVMGYTHERRPLLLLTISTPERLKNIDAVRDAHAKRVTSGQGDVANAPTVTWMGYSVHGNEPSGSNASLLVAYYLAAAQGEKIEALLESNVILLDPSLNPDGLARFAQWVNSHKGKNISPDGMNREHNEIWPSGRTNHYWTDLNRDWLLLQHPESRARIANFHKWKPNVLTDFHEMGPHSTYFFQPGIPTRKHPLTPERNVDLTKTIADFHAAALDKQGVLYFTEESFDDFYYGKGSTYPDIHGGIGILFEQGSSRGHLYDTINGEVSFPTTVKNQLTTSLSTFDAVVANRSALLEYQASFYQQSLKLAKKDQLEGYLISEQRDKTSLYDFLEILNQHQIEVYPITKDIKVKGKTYTAQSSYFVPVQQHQYRLVKAIFSEQKNFQDNTFYDVSGWTLAHAFNIEFAKLTSQRGLQLATNVWHKDEVTMAQQLAPSYAYAFEWHDHLAPHLLTRLMQHGVNAKVATQALTAKTSEGSYDFAAGTILIPNAAQTKENWLAVLNQFQQEFANIKIHQIQSGLTATGVDLGSRQIAPVSLPKVLLVGGKGTSQYEVGEVWYYLDRFVGLAPTIVDIDRLSQVDFDNYTHIVMASGRYGDINKSTVSEIKQWVKKGGVIWGHKSAAKFLVDTKLLKTNYVSVKEMADQFPTDGLTYKDKDAFAGRKRIAGAIFNTQVDLAHPLAFALNREKLPVFKNSTFILEPSEKPFTNVLRYTETPLLAGYSHDTNVNRIAGNGALVAHSYGRGRVIGMSDNPVFRSYWYGTSRLLSNALFFAHAFRD